MASNFSYSQTQLLGLKGYIMVPEASIYEDGEFTFSINTNHQNFPYLYTDGTNARTDHHVYYNVGVALIPRVNLFVTLARLRNLQTEDRLGIGDRQAVISILALKEKKYLPSIVVNISNPFGTVNQYNSTNHILATKRFELKETISVSTTIGYGIPYTFIDSNNEDDPGYAFRKKDSDFLNGFFVGTQIIFKDQLYGNLEYDSDKLNLGVGYELWEKLSMQINVLGVDRGKEMGLSGGVRWTGVVK